MITLNVYLTHDSPPAISTEVYSMETLHPLLDSLMKNPICRLLTVTENMTDRYEQILKSTAGSWDETEEDEEMSDDDFEEHLCSLLDAFDTWKSNLIDELMEVRDA